MIKDYKLEIQYHPGKPNVVADALSRKSHVNMLLATKLPPELLVEFEHLNLGFVTNTQGTASEVEPTREQDIQRGQKTDEKIQEFARLIKEDKAPGFHLDRDRIVWFKHRICVPDIQHIKM